MIDGTEKPTTPSKNKNDLWGEARPSPLVGIVQNFFLLALIPANRDVVKTFFILMYTNVMSPYVYVIVYPLQKWFATYFKCDWPIKKLVSFFHWGASVRVVAV